MCSRYVFHPKHESMKSLLSICVEYLLSHIDTYYNNFAYLPVHIKNRILKRLTSVKIHYPNITEIYGLLVHTQLKRIDFTLYELSDDLLNIMRDCKEMRELILTRNENTILTEKALLNTIPNFDKLIILQVENCYAITDKIIRIIVSNCQNLSEIDVAGCKNLSDESLIELSSLTELKALNISRTKITNKGIISLANGSSASVIKELRLSDCEFVTHIAINSICEKCKALEVLVFNNCANANDQSQVNFDSSNFTKLKQLTWTVYW